jgi:hypothetical protein
LREYTEQKNADDIRRAWLQGVRSALEESWTLHATSDGGDAWAIRARIRGERFVLRHLTELARSINSLKPETEPA